MALQTRNLGDLSINEVVSTSKQISSYVEEKFAETACMTIEVFPTDKIIPAGAVDSNDQSDENSVASIFGFDNATATGLAYAFAVPAQMT